MSFASFLRPALIVAACLTQFVVAQAANSPDSARSSLIGARFSNGIAAQVEDRIITVGDIRRVLGPISEIGPPGSLNDAKFRRALEEAEDNVIQDLVDQVLIVKEFYSDPNRRIPQAVIDGEIRETITTRFGGDRAKFLSYLRSLGKTEREFRRIVEEDIIVSAMRGQRRRSQNVVSPARIENFYTENRDRFYQTEGVHLRLIKLSQIADENCAVLQQTAEKLLARLREGADFATLARSYSQDGNKNRGGDLGWLSRSDLRDELATVAFSLEAGAFSSPIQVGSDIFILFAEEKRLAGIQPIEKVREQIEQILLSDMGRESQERWLERLRRNAFVRTFN